jgi:beta-lactamase regulating signal transducer with metallopeptidase domain
VVTAGTLDAVVEVARWIGGRLLAGSIEGAVVISVLALVCWRCRSLPASWRALLWWVASLKLVLVFATLPAIPVPVLPAAEPPAAPATRVGTPTPAAASSLSPPPPSRSLEARSSSAADSWLGITWLLGAVGAWLLGVALHAIRVVRSMRCVRRIRQRSSIASADIAALTGDLAREVGLRAVPPVRISTEVNTPQAVGIFRPAVLLPSSIDAFPLDERRMAIAHELVHIRRRDVLLGLMPACAERLFFFHPLARLAAREYVLAREAACDAAVMRALALAPQDYGRFLLRLGVTARTSGFTAAGASGSAATLTRRLNMLGYSASTRARRAPWFASVIVVLAVLPYQLVARTTAAQESSPQRPASLTSETSVSAVVAAELARHGGPDSAPESIPDRPVPLASASSISADLVVEFDEHGEPARATGDVSVRALPEAPAQTAGTSSTQADDAETQRLREVQRLLEEARREADRRVWQVERQALLAHLVALRSQIEREANTSDAQAGDRVQVVRSQLADLEREIEAAARRGGPRRQGDLDALRRELAELQEVSGEVLERQTYAQVMTAMRALEGARGGQTSDEQLLAAREAAASARARADQMTAARLETLIERAQRTTIRERDTTLEPLQESQRARDELQRQLAQLQAEQERIREAQRALMEDARVLSEDIERLRREAKDPDAAK